MTKHVKTYAPIVIAAIALVLSIRTSLRGSPAAKDCSACVDQHARERVDQLSRALVERDAMIARLVQSAQTPTASTPSAPPPSVPSSTTPVGEIRRYAHIQSQNPAVTVTQKPDGTYDIRTTDPALSGSVITVTGVTATGDEETLMVRIP